MSEINKVLNDESKNDKELIKELSVYVKNHRDKNLSIDKKFFEDVIDITLKNIVFYFYAQLNNLKSVALFQGLFLNFIRIGSDQTLIWGQ